MFLSYPPLSYPPVHTIIFVGLSVYFSSWELPKKFIGASLFTYTLVCINISKSASLTKSCRYLSLETPYNELCVSHRYPGTKHLIANKANLINRK
jgi:hypothetical protein